MTERENYLRAAEFRNPDWIPVTHGFLFASWHKYRERLEEIVLDHPRLFPEHTKGKIDFDDFPSNNKKDSYYRDEWGCLWHNIQGGQIGQVVEHPLEEWKALDTYAPPDPDADERIDWEKTRHVCVERKRRGLPVCGHGSSLFDLLIELRGFQNLMVDLALDAPGLRVLTGMIRDYNMKLITRWLEIGVDVMYFHGDLGTQRGPMISRSMFVKHIKPLYKELFSACREGSSHVHYSCDGNILELVDDLIECGVTLHDPQYRANTLEGIASVYGGKMCVLVDLDQQHILPFGTPEDVRRHVKDVAETLYAPEGGLMIYAEIQPAYPLANIRALCEALEEYCLDIGK